MKRVVLIGLAVVLVGASMAAAQTIVGSKHDLSVSGPNAFYEDNTPNGEVCVFCHTPHQPSGQTTDPLWNHELSAQASYGMYSSPTFNGGSTIADIGGGTGVSNLCMSCHDGTVGVGAMYNDPNYLGGVAPDNDAVAIPNTSSAYLGIDLTNDHPVNFTYNDALVTADGGAGLRDPDVAPVAPLLFASTVQCASCHNPHDPQFGSFLVMSNAQSTLCTTCHIK